LKLKIIIVLILVTGCMTSRYTSEADIPSINRALVSNGSINFFTKDGKEFELDVTYMDSLRLSGIGRYKDSSNLDWKAYNGDVKLDSIDLVLINKYNTSKNILTVGSGVALLALYTNAVRGQDTPELQADIEYTYTGPYQPGGGGSSCPFVYSWTGSDWALEGEAIGTAFGKALELQTGTILRSVRKGENNVKARVTNERPETHYLNQLRCRVYEAEENTKVYLDNFENAWPVCQLDTPIDAFDYSGRSILPELTNVDRNYWKSRLENISLGSNFRDEIELTFDNPDLIDEASLVIHAINTRFSETVFQNIFGFLGDQSLSFIQAVENDPEMITIMNDWLEKSSLKVDVWNGSEWIVAGRIQPVANVVPFARLIRIPVLQMGEKTVRVRLSCLADVWELDGAFMDFSETKPLHGVEIPLVEAISSKGKNISPIVLNNDENYQVMVPGDYIDLFFKDSNPARPDEDKFYVLNVKGYLHEWIINSDEEFAMQSLSVIQGIDKIYMLKQLLSKNEMFLPLVYSDWMKKRN
jgi:hypothetical protein